MINLTVYLSLLPPPSCECCSFTSLHFAPAYHSCHYRCSPESLNVPVWVTLEGERCYHEFQIGMRMERTKFLSSLLLQQVSIFRLQQLKLKRLRITSIFFLRNNLSLLHFSLNPDHGRSKLWYKALIGWASIEVKLNEPNNIFIRKWQDIDITEGWVGWNSDDSSHCWKSKKTKWKWFVTISSGFNERKEGWGGLKTWWYEGKIVKR